MNPNMAQDLVKCREAELRMSRGPGAARPAWQRRRRGRHPGGSRRALLRGRALIGRLLVEAGLHLLATTE
jgi:hypothetical protein